VARRINLVPASDRARTTTNVGMLVAIACAVIVFFALGLVYFLWNGTLNDREQELADVQQQRQLVEAQAATLKQYEELALDRQQAEETVRQVYAGRTPVADILDSISLVVPESVWFDGLGITTLDPAASLGAADARGRSDNMMAVEGSTYTFEDVAQFLVRLKLISALSGIDLQNASSGQESEDVKTFSIEAGVLNTQDPEMPLPVSQVEVEGL
jgi:Tfp pilus assembly protein PilN